MAVQVSYSRSISRSGLEKLYQPYFANTEGKVCVVICIDLYYAGPKSYSATVENLHRSAISVWIMKPGKKTCDDGDGLEGFFLEGSMDLYLSDLFGRDLPVGFIRSRPPTTTGLCLLPLYIEDYD